jgi:hypothetical protein
MLSTVDVHVVAVLDNSVYLCTSLHVVHDELLCTLFYFCMHLNMETFDEQGIARSEQCIAIRASL